MKKVLISLDASGSMRGKETQTINGVHEFVTGLDEMKDTELEIVIWDSSRYQTVFKNKLENYIPLLPNQYRCADMTPLLDSFAKGILSLMSGGYEKSVLVIMTDGLENMSREYDTQSVSDLVSKFRSLGNEVIFLGAGIDSWGSVDLAVTMGTQSDLSYKYNFGQENAVYKSVSEKTRGILRNDV